MSCLVSLSASGDARREDFLTDFDASIGPTRAILYLHGGGFMIAPSPAHWTWIRYLAEELDAVVYVVPYPLAPTNTIQEVRTPVIPRDYI